MHEVVYRDTVGVANRNHGPLLAECEAVPGPLRNALCDRFGRDCRLTPIQDDALKAGICALSRHFIVSAPTNSGKTLVALFKMFSDLIAGRGRCVYVAPLKVLAEEKRIELQELMDGVARAGGPKIRLSITTGDYQLSGDFFGSPPPEEGELIICTPERLEILLRSKENLYWARTVSTVVLDEFHLLGDLNRGATMEILMARILSSCPWSRIIALSASIGGLNELAEWFAVTGTPVEVLENPWRYPTLHRSIVSTTDKPAYVRQVASEVLDDPNRTLLIFVNQKREAESTVKQLKKEFKSHKNEITYIHAGLTLPERQDRQRQLQAKKVRIIAATTALKMGIDAPVTDVLIRDLNMWGNSGRATLDYADILQMMGRAGRRDIPGNAVALGDDDQVGALVELFKADRLEPLTPRLLSNRKKSDEAPNPMLSLLLSEVTVQGEATETDLGAYVKHTFSGHLYGSVDARRHINELIRLKLLYKEEDRPDQVYPAKLGKTISQTGLSPESGALIAGFLRALIKLDEHFEKQKGRRFGYLKRLTDLDLLFLSCACFECRGSLLRLPAKKDIEDTQEFIEVLNPEEKPVTNLWSDEGSAEYPTRRLLTSLRMPFNASKKGDAEKVFYKLMRTAVLLHQHAKGAPLASLAERYRSSVGALENGLKYSVLWMLNCISQICNSKRCYKMDFLMMRSLKLIECVSVGSQLGELLLLKGIGRRSVEKLMRHGIESMDDLADISKARLSEYGLNQKQVDLIDSWGRRRSR
jgi:replicative superfamily II helicase